MSLSSERLVCLWTVHTPVLATHVPPDFVITSRFVGSPCFNGSTVVHPNFCSSPCGMTLAKMEAPSTPSASCELGSSVS